MSVHRKNPFFTVPMLQLTVLIVLTVLTLLTVLTVLTVLTELTVVTILTVWTEITENLKKYDLLTHLLTTWNQEMLAHLKIALEKYVDNKSNLLTKQFVCKDTCWGICPPWRSVLEKYKKRTNFIYFNLSHMSFCVTHVQSSEEEESCTILR